MRTFSISNRAGKPTLHFVRESHTLPKPHLTSLTAKSFTVKCPYCHCESPGQKQAVTFEGDTDIQAYVKACESVVAVIEKHLGAHLKNSEEDKTVKKCLDDLKESSKNFHSEKLDERQAACDYIILYYGEAGVAKVDMRFETSLNVKISGEN